MSDFNKRLKSIEKRLNKATPWGADDDEPASIEWRKNIDANADLCRNAYADLKLLYAVVRLQNFTLTNVHGLLSEDYFENWEECLMEIENSNIDTQDLLVEEGNK